MRLRNIPWKLVMLGFGLAATSILFFAIVFIYAESTKDPDAIEAPAFLISVGLMMAAFLMVPVTIAVWLHNSRRE